MIIELLESLEITWEGIFIFIFIFI